jgi:outer membrane protein assembly factor BamB
MWIRRTATTLLPLVLFVCALPGTPALAAGGDALWSDTQAGDAGDQDAEVDVAVSADGATVVAAGWIERTGHGKDFLSVAYDPVTGDVLWSRTYDGRRHKQDSASGVAIVGSKVVVSGTSQGSRRAGDDIATVAYDLTTGARLWVHRYDSPEHGEESGSGVDAGGGRAYAIGQAGGRLAVVAISLKTGTTSWTYRTRRSG